MSRRQSFFAYLALIVGVVSLASSFARTSPGQGTTIPSVAGRYAVAAAGGTSPDVFVIDTFTGQTWTRSTSGSVHWRDLGTPAGGK